MAAGIVLSGSFLRAEDWQRKVSEMSPDQKLYVAKCGRCHEAFSPGVSEMTWNRWIWKWKDKARLSDDEYDRLMAYARREREARQAGIAVQTPAR